MPSEFLFLFGTYILARQAIFLKQRFFFRSREVASFIILYSKEKADSGSCIGLMIIPAHHIFLMELEKGQICTSKKRSGGLKLRK